MKLFPIVYRYEAIKATVVIICLWSKFVLISCTLSLEEIERYLLVINLCHRTADCFHMKRTFLRLGLEQICKSPKAIRKIVMQILTTVACSHRIYYILYAREMLWIMNTRYMSFVIKYLLRGSHNVNSRCFSFVLSHVSLRKLKLQKPR